MGLRTRRALALAASAMFVAAACGGTATSTPTGTPAATSTPGATSSGPAASPSASRSAVDQKLFRHQLRAEDTLQHAPNGTLLMGEWRPDTLNLWFSTSYSAVEAMQPAMRGFVAITSDGKYIPDLATTVPTPENGGVVINGTTFDVKVTLKPIAELHNVADLVRPRCPAAPGWPARAASRPPGHGGAQPGDTHDPLHRRDLLGQDLLSGRGDLGGTAGALVGSQRPDPAALPAATAPRTRCPAPSGRRLNPATSAMIAYPCLGPSDRLLPVQELRQSNKTPRLARADARCCFVHPRARSARQRIRPSASVAGLVHGMLQGRFGRAGQLERQGAR